MNKCLKERRISCLLLQHPRLAPSPMEPRGIAVDYHPDTDGVTVWYSTQTPHRARTELAAILKVGAARIDVIAPDVGGAFGMKASLFPEEVMAVWAALKLRRSTRWIASRSEDFLTASHGRGARCEGQLAVAEDGRFLALRARIDSPLGHWLPSSAAIPAWNAGRILPCGYLVEAVDIVSKAHMSHTAPVGIYRGAGRPEANCLMERLVDCTADKTGLDPLEIRTLNLLPEERFPHKTPTGYVLDSGRYAAVLEILRREADYDGLVDMCRKRRQRGEIVGLGLGFYVEPCGTGWESARVTLNPDGTALIATGGSTQGHCRETAFAQIAADALALPIDAVQVAHGSTSACPAGIGTLASRSTAIGGSAVRQACLDVLDLARSGDACEPLTAETVYTADSEAWGYGCYLIVLSIDPDTGTPTIERAHCIDDAGTIINPAMVDGQIRGGFAHGLGEAFMEQVVYDDCGQLVTGSFMDYALPRACDVPELTISKLATPSPGNILGAKGVGEAGTIGAPAAILNAALDALRPFGVETLQMPLTSEQLWRAVQSAQQDRSEEIFPAWCQRIRSRQYERHLGGCLEPIQR